MIRARLITALLAMALAYTACAPKPQSRGDDEAARTLEQATNPKPKTKKPVRMNGRGDVSSISLEEMFALQGSGNALIFDARPAYLFHLGHIPGAENLPKSDCENSIAKMDERLKSAVAAGKTIIVYCSGLLCPDARTVAMHISGYGHPAKIFSGGYDAWKKAELPTD
ncbi:MAG: rhodanese-like domain-containing protein [Verrucomicrobiota bacterium]